MTNENCESKPRRSSSAMKDLMFKFGYAIFVALIGWGISLEIRLTNLTALPDKVGDFEKAMYPVLVEYGVKQELAKRGDLRGTSAPLTKSAPNGDIEAAKPEHDSVVREQKDKAEKFLNAAVQRPVKGK